MTKDSTPLDFGDGWEPNGKALNIARDYLIHQPEQGDWPWEDHCEGIAGGILDALHQSGFVLVPVAELNAEADRAHERSRAQNPPLILSGFDWFEWGVRRAVAITLGQDRYDLTTLPMDPSEPVEND